MSIFGPAESGGAAVGQTVGAIAGSYIPIPYVGSFLGGTVGKAIGGLFGGDEKRTNYGVGLKLDNGVYTPALNPKDKEIEQSRAWSQGVGDIVTEIAKVGGFTLAKPKGWYETNQKDKGTFYRQGETKIRLSNNQGDTEAVVRDLLNRTGFEGGSDASKAALKSALDNGQNIEQIYTALGGNVAAPARATGDANGNGLVTTQTINDPQARLAAGAGGMSLIFTGGAILAILLYMKGK